MRAEGWCCIATIRHSVKIVKTAVLPLPCRYSALETLFDTLKFDGNGFSGAFWGRIFDSVLLPIFDHVRAEVTDTTTFTSERRRAQVTSCDVGRYAALSNSSLCSAVRL